MSKTLLKAPAVISALFPHSIAQSQLLDSADLPISARDWINSFLTLFVEKTRISKRIFDFFGRVLPIPTIIVRGVPIKIILPLNQVGVYNTCKSWEDREPEVLDWIDGFEKG
jgi:hypothetical protein